MSGEGGVPRLTNLAESMGMEITEFGEGLCVVELTVGQMHLNFCLLYTSPSPRD